MLCSLINLNLQGCELLVEIPDCFTSFPALQVFDLSGTMIETIPPSINQVSTLHSLTVGGCRRLQSLPALPCLLTKLCAEGCTELEMVSVSVTGQTQGLDQIVSGKRTEILSYSDCISLDEKARSNIMDDAHSRIMRMAAASKRLSSADVWVLCPGNEIPKWFTCQTEGSSMKIKLPQHWYDDSNFLGIALCSVFPIINSDHPIVRYQCRCEMILITDSGETHRVDLGMAVDMYQTAGTDQVLVWCNLHKLLPDEAKWCTEAFFHFYTNVHDNHNRNRDTWD